MTRQRASSPRAGSLQRSTAFRTRIDIRAERRRPLVDLLNARLADAFDLYAQTKHAHWNVKGRDFYQLHLLFDELAETVEGHVDLLAERATALGGVAKGTLRMAAQGTSLKEMPPDTTEGMAFVEALADRYATHAENVREAIDEAEDHEDKGTADLFTQIVRDLDKALYFLEAHLQGRDLVSAKGSR